MQVAPPGVGWRGSPARTSPQGHRRRLAPEPPRQLGPGLPDSGVHAAFSVPIWLPLTAAAAGRGHLQFLGEEGLLTTPPQVYIFRRHPALPRKQLHRTLKSRDPVTTEMRLGVRKGIPSQH